MHALIATSKKKERKKNRLRFAGLSHLGLATRNAPHEGVACENQDRERALSRQKQPIDVSNVDKVARNSRYLSDRRLRRATPRTNDDVGRGREAQRIEQLAHARLAVARKWAGRGGREAGVLLPWEPESPALGSALSQ